MDDVFNAEFREAGTGKVDTAIVDASVHRYMNNHAISAYEIAVANGYEGTETEWLASLKCDEGLNGFSARLPQGEYNPSNYLVVDDGTSAKKISINDFVEGTKENIYGIRGNLIKVEPKTVTVNGVTITVDQDGVVTLNGTTTDAINWKYNFSSDFQTIGEGTFVPKGSIIVISGAENYKESITYNPTVVFQNIYATSGDPSNWRPAYAPLSSRTLVITQDCWVKVFIRTDANSSFNNYKIYPSIHVIGQKGVETAYNNKELTDKVTALENKANNVIGVNYIADKDVNSIDSNIDLTVYLANTNAPNIPSNDRIYKIITTSASTGLSTAQIALDLFGNIFSRSRTSMGTWNSWKRLVTEDELTALAARVTALENK